MEWTVHGERELYASPWMSLALVDVEVPGGERFEHHVLRMPQHAAGVVVTDPDRGVLLLWRHRFITGGWGHEVPAGRVEPGETPAGAGAREVLEETGWRVTGELVPLATWTPMSGSTDQVFHALHASGAELVGEPSDPSESERVEWVPSARVHEMLLGGGIENGLTLTALLVAAARGLWDPRA